MVALEVMVVEELDKAYMAGLIDADGSIQIIGSYVPRLGRKHIMLGLKVGMQSYDSVQYASACFEANVNTTAQKHKEGGVYEVVVWQKKARNALVQILPYMKAKKIQAEFGIWFYDLAFGSRPRGAVKLTNIELEIRELGAKVMSLLNHRDSMYLHGKSDEFSGRLSPLLKEFLDMFTLSQAVEGEGSTEGATTRETSPNSNSPHERPALYH